ncbi:MAG: glycosyltransferase family 2 protein [bacterium]|nr:glycosyltransferase family 2 protein [bacterium]
MLRKRLSFIVPAFNEERRIGPTVGTIHSVAPKYCRDYEILVVNDKSTDRTGKIIDLLSRKDKKVKVLHNSKNMGMGYSYFRGLDNAKFEYVMTVFGDNDHPPESVGSIISKMGQADIIIPYYKNLHISKTWFRHIVSITYVHLVNYLTGLTIPYYNGVILHRTDLIRQVPKMTTGFGFQAETIVYLAKRGATYLEVDIFNREKKTNSSAAFRLKNILAVSRSFFRLLWNYKIFPRYNPKLYSTSYPSLK